MPRTGILWSEDYFRHDTGPHHPEKPARLEAVRKGLTETGLWSKCEILAPTPIDLKLVERVHAIEYINQFRNACTLGQHSLHTPDCAICPASFEVACLAAGGVVEAVDAVMAGRIRNAFCPVRPPGHHAERRNAMGFCFFNNIAVAAERLRVHHGLKRIALLDWDVHHGNGTQHHVQDDPDTLFISIHQHPYTLFPGTGFAEERGVGNVINLPMVPGSEDDDYRKAFEETLLPAVDAFKPEFILADLGFDPHYRDPLAQIELTTDMFEWMTARVRAAAESLCRGRLVTVLEGGYDLNAVTECTQAHVEALIAGSA
ncbi:MAG TPA: histone deacetylase [Phycisphaerae bacterium]|nr:histone deacetylase [Phycisphaerae bacterium]